MIKLYKKSSIPDLRKKTGYTEQLNLEGINIASCIFIMMVILILIISILFVAANPSPNFPTNI